MDQRKNHLLTPLMITAAISVVAFSSIGVAAITGHLSIVQPSFNPFSVFAEAPVMSSSASFNQIAANATHKGLTRNAGEELAITGKPVDFRLGAPVPQRKPACQNCGVVDTIKMRETRKVGEPPSPAPDPSGSQYTYAGNESERQPGSKVSYVVTVRMEDGTVRTIHENQYPPFGIGKRVKLVNGAIIPLG